MEERALSVDRVIAKNVFTIYILIPNCSTYFHSGYIIKLQFCLLAASEGYCHAVEALSCVVRIFRSFV